MVRLAFSELFELTESDYFLTVFAKSKDAAGKVW